jgi:hypothetical protein
MAIDGNGDSNSSHLVQRMAVFPVPIVQFAAAAS